MDNKKKKRYILSYPLSGKKIHKADNINTGVRKCYNEFKKISDIDEGLFSVTDLDDQTEYKFKVKNKNIINLSEENQDGGAVRDIIITKNPADSFMEPSRNDIDKSKELDYLNHIFNDTRENNINKKEINNLIDNKLRPLIHKVDGIENDLQTIIYKLNNRIDHEEVYQNTLDALASMDMDGNYEKNYNSKDGKNIYCILI